MFSFKLDQIILLSIIPFLIYGRSVLYVNSKVKSIQYNKRSADYSTELTTISPLISDLISEQIQLDSTETTVTPNDSTDADIDDSTRPPQKWKCSLDEEEIRSKVTEILRKFIPTLLRLRPIQRGDGLRIILDKGKLTINKDFRLIGQPICEEVNDETIKYRLVVLFENLIGLYDWKIYNLFGNTFSESVIISIRQIQILFVLNENMDGKVELNDLKVGKVDGFKVDVNIPEHITGIRLLKRMIQYFISRISTFIANRSLNSIKSNLQNILLNSIKDKIQLNFKVVKEKLIFN